MFQPQGNEMFKRLNNLPSATEYQWGELRLPALKPTPVPLSYEAALLSPIPETREHHSTMPQGNLPRGSWGFQDNTTDKTMMAHY